MTQILTKEQIADIKAKAKEATPGPWFMHDFSSALLVDGKPLARDVTVSCDHHSTLPVASMGGGLYGYESVRQGIADATFIAAANPEIILAMIATLEAQQAEIERLKGEYARGIEDAAKIAEKTWEFTYNAAHPENPEEEWVDVNGTHSSAAIRALLPKQEELK